MTDYVDPIDFKPAMIAELDQTAIADMILRCAYVRFPGGSAAVHITGGCGDSDAPLLARVVVTPKRTHVDDALRGCRVDRS